MVRNSDVKAAAEFFGGFSRFLCKSDLAFLKVQA
jgi:hypothetical protein